MHTISPTVPWDVGETTGRRRPHQPFGVTAVWGGQAGSEGKGAIAGYLARRYEWGAACCSFGPSSGHTWVPSGGGDPVVVHQIPMSCVSDSVGLLCISAGAAFDVERLMAEIEMLEGRGIRVRDRLAVDPRAVVVTEADRLAEAEMLADIASTAQGGGHARAGRVMRQPHRIAASDARLKDLVRPVAPLLAATLGDGRGVLLEGAQGVDLDLMHGYEYPFVTSHGCTPAQLLADAGVAPQWLVRSVMVIRTYPIRVGNTERGQSGPYPSRETRWGKLGLTPELTTTTRRERRVFEPAWERLASVARWTCPTEVAVTHADYLDDTIYGWHTPLPPSFLWPAAVSEFLWRVEKAVARGTASPRVTLVKTGPEDGHIVDTAPPW